MDIEARGDVGAGGAQVLGVEEEEGHKEDCIHRSLSLGFVVRYQEIQKRNERCVVCKSKGGGEERGGKEEVTRNSEYAGLSSIACKHTNGRKAVKTATVSRQTAPPHVTKG
jgi:hypothetical protein